MLIRSKYDSTCSRCGAQIAFAEPVNWTPGTPGVICTNCLPTDTCPTCGKVGALKPYEDYYGYSCWSCKEEAKQGFVRCTDSAGRSWHITQRIAIEEIER